jgi:hypothetical protein
MHPLNLTVAALAVACAGYFASANAKADDIACVETMANVEATLQRVGADYTVIGPDNLEAFATRVFAITRVPASEVTGALMVGAVFGIETADGCFSPTPLPMPKEFGA